MTTFTLVYLALMPANVACDPVPAPVVLVRATGIGYPPPRMRSPRARLMARRAAEVVAVRNLARKLGYGDHATLRGFRYVSALYRADGSVEVTVEKARPIVRRVCRVVRPVRHHHDGRCDRGDWCPHRSDRYVKRGSRNHVSHHRTVRLHSHDDSWLSRSTTAVHRGSPVRQPQRHVHRR